jgi:transposase-like protein
MSTQNNTTIPNLKSLKNILFDEQECINFLFEQDILYKPQSCSHCNSSLYRERKLWRCRNRKCRKSVSIFKDSFFSENHLNCSDTMLIGYLWLCKTKHTSIIHMTGHSPNTITDYMNLFRELIIDTLEDEDDIIGGDNIIVEIDESKFGRRKYNRGRVIDGVWIVGGIERTEEKKCFVKVVENRTAETLHEIIRNHVAPGSIVHTDMWRGYTGIEELNVTHRTVNHSENFVDHDTGVHTNTIEGLWNGIKIGIPPKNRKKDKITDHLLEFIWRKKNKDNLWNSFLDALKTTGYFNNEDDNN